MSQYQIFRIGGRYCLKFYPDIDLNRGKTLGIFRTLDEARESANTHNLLYPAELGIREWIRCGLTHCQGRQVSVSAVGAAV
jgi:hypothetical protein